ncbi:hypothetical protein Slin14017_G090290 [Septoria linicola]|nr:hypothetical protein Slin14017_G090290 [Septoria linicola]
MEASQQALFSKTTRQQRQWQADQDAAFPPAITPASTMDVNSTPDFGIDKSVGSSTSELTPKDLSLPSAIRPQTTEEPSEVALLWPRVGITSVVHEQNEAYQHMGQIDLYHGEDGPAFRRSGTGIALRAGPPKRIYVPSDTEDGDDFAHQRSAIESFYDARRDVATGAGPDGSEFDGDYDGDVQSQASHDTASLHDRDQEGLEFDADDDTPYLSPFETPRTDSLEGCASVDTESDGEDHRNHQEDKSIGASDASSALSTTQAVWETEEPAALERMYTLPSITEESLRMYEDKAEEHQQQLTKMSSVDEISQCPSNTGHDGSELERVPSETQSAPAPLDRRGRRMTKTDDHARQSSLTEEQRMRGRARRPSYLSTKSSPARPAMTAISVRTAESPRVNTVYDHSKAGHFSLSPADESIKTAHTVQSDLGTYQMVWEDAQSSGSGDSSGTMLEQRNIHTAHASKQEYDAPYVVTQMPIIDRVKCKLTAWTYEKQHAPTDPTG